LLALSVSHLAIVKAARQSYWAIPIYLGSFFVMGLVLAVGVSGAAKGFAPGTPNDVRMAYLIFGIATTVAVVISIGGWMYLRRGRGNYAMGSQ
jgi:hypothetical protein